MNIYLPIAEVSINVFFLVGIGALTGILAGLFGIGGGFFLIPVLILIGIPPSIATASSLTQIIATATSGSFTHYKMGNIDFKMAFWIIVGGFAGGSVGVYVVNILLAMGNFDLFIRIIYIITLSITGSLIFMESFKTICDKNCEGEPSSTISKKILEYFKKMPLRAHFKSINSETSIILPAGAGAIAGFLSAIMGVGGGFLMVPIMIYFIGIPTVIAVGTSLFQIIFTATNITLQQAIMNHTVDIILVVALFCGAVFGAKLGAYMTKKLKSAHLRIYYAILLLSIMLKLLLDFIIKPDILINII